MFTPYLLVVALAPAALFASSFPTNLERLENHITHISEDITNSVVHVKNEGSFNNKKFSGMGSGFVISKEGLILTNHHVVDNSLKVTVKFNGDLREYEAKVLGSDEPTDVAVLQVDAKLIKNLRPVALGKSKLSKVGQWVLAVGNPYGFDRTVSFGIISAKGRNVPGAPVLNDFLQTDAFIAPGSSGGPLLNMHGEVIGINSRGGSGLGFTIPIETALEVKDKLLKSGGIKRGWLGIQLHPIGYDLRKRLKIPEAQGVMISKILKSSNFYGRLLPLDTVLRVNGDVVLAIESKDLQPVIRRLSELPVGKEVSLEVMRAGKTQTIKGIVKERPPVEGKKWQNSLGFVSVDIDDAVAEKFQLEQTKGICITYVEQGSSAHHAGLARGDVIVEAEGRPVKDIDSAQAALGTEKSEYLLHVVRGESHSYLLIKK
jgi:serine protease Do